jgi:hypothetical protein
MFKYYRAEKIFAGTLSSLAVSCLLFGCSRQGTVQEPITPEEVSAAFLKGGLKAINGYQGNDLIVRGEVTGKLDDSIWLDRVDGANAILTIKCTPTKDAGSQFRHLERYDIVTIRGICDYVGKIVSLTDCKLLEKGAR